MEKIFKYTIGSFLAMVVVFFLFGGEFALRFIEPVYQCDREARKQKSERIYMQHQELIDQLEEQYKEIVMIMPISSAICLYEPGIEIYYNAESEKEQIHTIINGTPLRDVDISFWNV